MSNADVKSLPSKDVILVLMRRKLAAMGFAHEWGMKLRWIGVEEPPWNPDRYTTSTLSAILPTITLEVRFQHSTDERERLEAFTHVDASYIVRFVVAEEESK